MSSKSIIDVFLVCFFRCLLMIINHTWNSITKPHFTTHERITHNHAETNVRQTHTQPVNRETLWLRKKLGWHFSHLLLCFIYSFICLHQGLMWPTLSWAHHVAKIELLIALSLLPKCWDYRCAPPWPVYLFYSRKIVTILFVEKTQEP